MLDRGSTPYRDDTWDGTGTVPYKIFWIAAKHAPAWFKQGTCRDDGAVDGID